MRTEFDPAVSTGKKLPVMDNLLAHNRAERAVQVAAAKANGPNTARPASLLTVEQLANRESRFSEVEGKFSEDEQAHFRKVMSTPGDLDDKAFNHFISQFKMKPDIQTTPDKTVDTKKMDIQAAFAALSGVLFNNSGLGLLASKSLKSSKEQEGNFDYQKGEEFLFEVVGKILSNDVPVFAHEVGDQTLFQTLTGRLPSSEEEMVSTLASFSKLYKDKAGLQ